jgi:hypothetical protein
MSRVENVDHEQSQLFYSILVCEGLADWRITIAADGYCWQRTKLIQIPATSSLAGFLHEVAHAHVPEPDPCGLGEHFHGAKFVDEFQRLVDKWMVFNDRSPRCGKGREMSMYNIDAVRAPRNADDRVYPCMFCGRLRSKNEGGTTFTACDKCWDPTKGGTCIVKRKKT